MTYLRSMSETILDANKQPMFVWEQAGSAAATHATFHVLARMYSYDTLTDLSAALRDVIQEIDNYRSDMAKGFIDENGCKTPAGHEEQKRIENIQENSTYFE